MKCFGNGKGLQGGCDMRASWDTDNGRKPRVFWDSDRMEKARVSAMITRALVDMDFRWRTRTRPRLSESIRMLFMCIRTFTLNRGQTLSRADWFVTERQLYKSAVFGQGDLPMPVAESREKSRLQQHAFDGIQRHREPIAGLTAGQNLKQYQ